MSIRITLHNLTRQRTELLRHISTTQNVLTVDKDSKVVVETILPKDEQFSAVTSSFDWISNLAPWQTIKGFLPFGGPTEVQSTLLDGVVPHWYHLYIPSIYEKVQHFTNAPWWAVMIVGTVSIRIALFPITTRKSMNIPSVFPYMQQIDKLTKLSGIFMNEKKPKQAHKAQKIAQELAERTKIKSTVFCGFILSPILMLTVNRAYRHLCNTEALTSGGFWRYLDMTSYADVALYSLPLVVVSGISTVFYMNMKHRDWMSRRFLVIWIPVGALATFFFSYFPIGMVMHYAVSSWIMVLLFLARDRGWTNNFPTYFRIPPGPPITQATDSVITLVKPLPVPATPKLESSSLSQSSELEPLPTRPQQLESDKTLDLPVPATPKSESSSLTQSFELEPLPTRPQQLQSDKTLDLPVPATPKSESSSLTQSFELEPLPTRPQQLESDKALDLPVPATPKSESSSLTQSSELEPLPIRPQQLKSYKALDLSHKMTRKGDFYNASHCSTDTYTPFFEVGPYANQVEHFVPNEKKFKSHFQPKSADEAPGMFKKNVNAVTQRFANMQFKERYTLMKERRKLLRHGKKGVQKMYIGEAPTQVKTREPVMLTTKVSPGLKRYVLRKQYPMDTLEELDRKISYMERVQNKRW